MAGNGGLGSVYYFNATPYTVMLINNLHLLNAKVAGITQAGSYVPNGSSESRNSADNSNDATFGTNNSLAVSYPHGGQTYPVKIDPGQAQIGTDVQLYIFFNEVVLVLPSGAGTGSQQVFQGQPSSKEEMELFEQHGGAPEGGSAEA